MRAIIQFFSVKHRDAKANGQREQVINAIAEKTERGNIQWKKDQFCGKYWYKAQGAGVEYALHPRQDYEKRTVSVTDVHTRDSVNYNDLHHSLAYDRLLKAVRVSVKPQLEREEAKRQSVIAKVV